MSASILDDLVLMFTVTSVDQIKTGPSRAEPRLSREDAHVIDAGASHAFSGALEGRASGSNPHGSGAHLDNANYEERNTDVMIPSPAISGLDPISKLAFASNRAFFQRDLDAIIYADLYSPLESNLHDGPYVPHGYLDSPSTSAHAHLSPSTYQTRSRQGPLQSAQREKQQTGEAAYRLAEAERRNRLREEEKTRRTLRIQKQVDEGMIAFQLEKEQAAHHTAEVDRRNKQREQDKMQRRLDVQKQVNDGVRATQLEKECERVRVEADRSACRKWLFVPNTSSSSIAVDVSCETVDLYTALGRQMRGFWEESRPPASDQAQRNEVIADVQCAINAKWPGQGLQVAAFGSSVTGLITESSDLDLVLLDPTRPYGAGTPPELRRVSKQIVRHTDGMPEWYSTSQIAKAVRNSAKFRNIVPISGAHVPIVKMVHRKFNIPADININERFGLFNSQLIQAYADLQPLIVRPLIFFLKHWYSRSDLNDPSGKGGFMTFSSYTIALMALQVLQIEGVLPNLQSPVLLTTLNIRPSFLYSRVRRLGRGKNTRQRVVEEPSPPKKYDVTFATNHPDLSLQKRQIPGLAAVGPELKTVSKMDRLLGRMLVSFIRFYMQFDRRTQVVSVVNGSPLQRKKAPLARQVILVDSTSEDGGAERDRIGSDRSRDSFGAASRDHDARVGLREEQIDIWADEELVVQDPFIIDRNTSRNIKAAAIERWQNTMQSAADYLGLHKEHDASDAPRQRLKDAPLILDLCNHGSARLDANATSGPGERGTDIGAVELWRLQEKAEAQGRESAKQAAKDRYKEKRKQAKARRSEVKEAHRLREDMARRADKIEALGSHESMGSRNQQPSHNWRSYPNNGSGSSIGGSHSAAFGAGMKNDPSFVDMWNSPASSTAPAPPRAGPMHADTTKQAYTGRADHGPTYSAKTEASSETDASSESEDIDLVALRLARGAHGADS